MARVVEFLKNPHFPFFLLTPISKMSPTLARFLRYGRYNPNTESYWNERYRSGIYQESADTKYRVLDQEIMNLTPAGSRVLDVGCGTGRLMEKLRDLNFCSCVGIDVAEVSIATVQNKGFQAFKCKLPNQISNLKHDNFDVCTIIETLEHLSNPKKVLYVLSKVLRQDGLFIVSVPDDCMKPHECDEHVSSFDKQALTDLLSLYCNVETSLSIEADGHNYLIMRGRKALRF